MRWVCSSCGGAVIAFLTVVTQLAFHAPHPLAALMLFCAAMSVPSSVGPSPPAAVATTAVVALALTVRTTVRHFSGEEAPGMANTSLGTSKAASGWNEPTSCPLVASPAYVYMFRDSDMFSCIFECDHLCTCSNLRRPYLSRIAKSTSARFASSRIRSAGREYVGYCRSKSQFYSLNTLGCTP